jgi:hypothetical protein
MNGRRWHLLGKANHPRESPGNKKGLFRKLWGAHRGVTAGLNAKRPWKSDGILRQVRAMRFALIATHAHEFRITTMRRVLSVSKAGYCARTPKFPQFMNGQIPAVAGD